MHETPVQGVAVSVAIAIEKGGVDATRRTVRGLMTQEVVDSHGEEVDFDSVVECLATWRGNIREMHQPKAVGKAVDIVVRSDIRAVEVEAYVSKGAEDTWQKCLDGTLGYYSLGGVADRVFGQRVDGTRGPRLLMRKIGELSLVDSGACPTSSIAVVKVVDGEPVAQLEPGALEPLTKGADTPAVTPVIVGANDAGHALALGILKGMGFRSERWNITNALQAIALLEDLVTEQCFESQYSSEAPDNAAQVELLRLAVMILIDFIATEFEQQFTDEALAKLADDEQAVVKAVIAKAGARHSKGDVVMLQAMHDNCVKLGAACGVEKMGDPKTPETTPATVAAPESASAAAATADPPAPVTEPVAKADDAPAPTPDASAAPSPAATPAAVPVTKAGDDVAVLVATEVTKAIDAVRSTFETQITELRATSDATIATLKDQVEKLSGQPAPGGPVANAHAIVVEKGSQHMADLLNDRGVAERVIAGLEEVAKSTTDSHARQELAEKSMALRLQHGIGAVHVPTPSHR
jgi:hypothetical protein